MLIAKCSVDSGEECDDSLFYRSSFFGKRVLNVLVTGWPWNHSQFSHVSLKKPRRTR